MHASSIKRVIALGVVTFTIALVGMTLPACAPKEASEQKQETTEPATVTIDWSPTSDCASCHTTESESLNNPATLAAKHQTSSESCMSCHSDEQALQATHEAVSESEPMPTKLKQGGFDSENCTTSDCHDLDPQEMIELTAESDALIDDKKTKVNPHEVATLTPSHQQADMSCASCHVAHKEKETFDYCLSCHHEGVFECGTCHAH